MYLQVVKMMVQKDQADLTGMTEEMIAVAVVVVTEEVVEITVVVDRIVVAAEAVDS